MCGLVYSKNFNGKPVNGWINYQFQKQRGRGTRGFGFYNRDNKHIIKTTKEKKIISNLKRRLGSEILFHHRWPTSTDNVPNASHPFTTGKFFGTENGYSGTTYILAHNGHISESKVRPCYEEHKKLGIKYSSLQPDGGVNDSEALLWEMALVLEGKKEEIGLGGSIAFICLAINEEKGDKLYFGRNYGSPLKIDLKEEEHLRLSSEGHGEDVETNTLFIFDPKDRLLTKRIMNFPSGYSHYPNYSSASYSKIEEKSRTTIVPSYKVPKHILDQSDDMVWDEEAQTLWMKDKDGKWSTWQEVADKYSDDEELKLISDMSKAEEDEEWEETLSEAALYRKSKEEEIPLDDISVTLAKSQGLKMKKGLGERQLDVRNRFDDYLKDNAGIYHSAYVDVCKDLEWMENQQKIVIASDDDPDTDLEYEISITQSVADALLCSPEWVDSSSVASTHKKFSKSITEAVDEVLGKRDTSTPERQTQLLIAQNNDDTPLTAEDISSFTEIKNKIMANLGGKMNVQHS